MKRIYYLLPIAGLLSLPTQMLAQKQTGSETILVNDSITLNLPEVFVKAERPLVKVADGKLQYDIPNLMKSKPVDNAFDILGTAGSGQERRQYLPARYLGNHHHHQRPEKFDDTGTVGRHVKSDSFVQGKKDRSDVQHSTPIRCEGGIDQCSY